MTKQEEIEAAFNDANIPRKLWFTKLGYYKLYGEYRFLYAHYLQLIALTSFVVVCYFLVRKTFLVFNLNMGGLHIYKREFAMSTKKTTRYACIDGVNYAVDGDIKFVLECKRGFLYGKDRKPEVVVHGKNIEWTPRKITLHSQSNKYRSKWPVQLDKNGRPDDWQGRVFETSARLYNPDLPFVDCCSE